MEGFMKWTKQYPMTLLMIISCLVGGPYFGAKMLYEQYDAYSSQILCRDVLADEMARSQTGDDGTEDLSQEQMEAILAVHSQNTEEDKQAAEEAARKKAEEEARRKAEPFSQVDESYLDDALFIGDSRTDTLNLYAGWDNATYYVKTGTNIWSIMDETVASDPESGKMISIDAALQKQQFGKVYIMLGVNELGTGTAETFYQQFKKVVARIQELQPEAVIFVESIIHVTTSRDAQNDAINNKEIDVRNQWLAKLADNETIFYLDANEVLDDESGALTEDYSFDGVHLKADQIEPWKAYILNHGVLR